MKITAIILLSACLTASANGYSQKVTLSEKNARLENVFEVIKKQTGYKFLYTVEQLQKAERITIELKEVDLEFALSILFKNQPLTYNIIEKTVIIKPKPEVPKAEDLPPPPIDVKGRLVNENGEPVIATVTVKGTKNATTTNSNGEFVLKGVDENATLVFSATNIEGIEIKLNGRTELNLSAKTKISKLDEVQIIGYGTTSQRYNVGSVSKITAEEISMQPVANPLLALQGRVPGLLITSTSGVPGASVKMQVRGQNSLSPTGGSGRATPLDNPLIIIDGVPFAPQNSNLNQYQSILTGDRPNNPYGGISPFSVINPSDIESIEVLRDADATAIYGSRGANGVVLITTKKGRSGKLLINANVVSGTSKVTRTMRMMNTREFLEMRREAFKNDNIVPDVNRAPDLFIFDTTKYTDWKDFFIGNAANTTNANVSVSGGSVNTHFTLGAGYNRETYIFPGDYKNQLATFNLGLKHVSQDQRFSINVQANYGYNQNDAANGIDGLTAYTLIPNYPDLRDADGNLLWRYKNYSLARPLSNPLQFLIQKYKFSSNNLISNLELSYQVIPGLTFRSSFGFNSLRSDENAQIPKAALEPRPGQVGTSTFGTSNAQTWIIEPRAEYVKNINRGRLSLLLGSTFQKHTGSSTTIAGSNYTDDALLGALQAAGTVSNPGSSYREYKYVAMYGRVNYIHLNKYIINLSGRRDGSSRFGPGNQFGNFGAIGVGWIFSEESFVKNNLPFLSYAKIRSSYGTTGNDNIGDYQYIATWGLGQVSYQNTRGYMPLNLYNPNFGWSVTRKLEIGLELGFLKDKILFNAAWYQNRSGNQLVNYVLPIQTGFEGVTQNFEALVQNRGIELQMNTTNIKTQSFSWTSSFNITFPRNKLLSFPGIENTAYNLLYAVGQSLNIMRGYQYAGLNDTTGMYQFYNADKTKTYRPLEMTSIISSADPEFYGGFRNTVTFKGFSVDIFFEFRKQTGRNALYYVYRVGNDVGSRFRNIPAFLLDSRWQKMGDKAIYQKFTNDNRTAYNAGVSFANSDAAVTDASFIRCKNISLAYALPKSITDKLRINKLSIYCNAQNLFIITKYLGNDPETQNFFGVPPLRTLVAGVQVTL